MYNNKASLCIIFHRNSKELNALKCQERQMLKLVEMIKTALNEIGCEELPSGCDELSMDQSFVDTNANREQQVRKDLCLLLFGLGEVGFLLIG